MIFPSPVPEVVGVPDGKEAFWDLWVEVGAVPQPGDALLGVVGAKRPVRAVHGIQAKGLDKTVIAHLHILANLDNFFENHYKIDHLILKFVFILRDLLNHLTTVEGKESKKKNILHIKEAPGYFF